MIDIYSIDYKEFLKELPQPFDLDSLQEYLNGGRQDILDNTDIFFENVRSKDLKEKDFSLFKKVDYIDDSTIVVFPFYLELFEYFNQHKNIQYSLKTLAQKFPNNKVVFFWNHDNDFSRFNRWVTEFKNIIILNYGYTSSPTKNDILLPFWTIKENLFEFPKTQFASFIGTPNNQLRIKLINNILKTSNNKLIYNSVFGDEYYKALNSTIFSLCPLGGHGGGGLSYRVYESFKSNSIPVIFVDNVSLPMTDIINWEEICVMLPEKTINNLNELLIFLDKIDYNKMIENIKITKNKFTLLSIQNYVYSKILNKKHE